MAGMRRKSVKGYPRINNCRINPEAFSLLNRIAGEHSIGWAIEKVCEQLTLQNHKKPLHPATNL